MEALIFYHKRNGMFIIGTIGQQLKGQTQILIIQIYRDIRKAQEEKDKNEKLRQKSGAQARIDLIKYKNKNIIQQRQQERKQESSSSDSKSSVSSDGIAKSKLTQELKDMNKNKHINLFEEEQEQIDRQDNTQALMQRETEFFKDKPFDITSKFMGSLNNNKPWYLKSRQQSTLEKQKTQKVRDQLSEFRQQGNTFYKVLKVEGVDKEKKDWEKEIEREKDLERRKEQRGETEKEFKKDSKSDKKAQKKMAALQKLAYKLKELIGSDDSSANEEKRNKQKLRESRLKREKSEKQKEQKLIQSHYQFDFQKK